MKSYTLTLNEAQIGVVQQALDMYFRVGMGQLRDVVEHAIPARMHIDDWCDRRDNAEIAMKAVKAAVMPELHLNAYYGIRSEKIDESNRIACDVHNVIRHHLAWERKPAGDISSVAFDTPYALSEHPLPKLVSVTGDDD